MNALLIQSEFWQRLLFSLDDSPQESVDLIFHRQAKQETGHDEDKVKMLLLPLQRLLPFLAATHALTSHLNDNLISIFSSLITTFAALFTPAIARCMRMHVCLWTPFVDDLPFTSLHFTAFKLR